MNKTQIEYCYDCLHPGNKFTPHKKGYRVCGTCKVEKKYFEFNNTKLNRHGIQNVCRKCVAIYKKKIYDPTKNRELNYKRKFGLTLNDYNQMLKSQNNRCAICNSKETGSSSHKYLLVDHCHTTEKIRGLLCNYCNVAIGYMKDDIELLKKAIIYLGKHGIILKEKDNDYQKN